MTDPTPETEKQAEEELAALQRMRDHMEQACLFDAASRYQRVIDARLERMQNDKNMC